MYAYFGYGLCETFIADEMGYVEIKLRLMLVIKVILVEGRLKKIAVGLFDYALILVSSWRERLKEALFSIINKTRPADAHNFAKSAAVF